MAKVFIVGLIIGLLAGFFLAAGVMSLTPKAENKIVPVAEWVLR